MKRALSPDMRFPLHDLARWTSDGEWVDQRDYHTGTLRALFRRGLLEVSQLGQIRITEAGKQLERLDDA